MHNDASAVADKLDEARALIERGWCQGWFAKDARGNNCMEYRPEAVCWCMGGALFKVGAPDAVDLLRRVIGGDWDGIADFNDAPGRTQAEVIDAFKRAAELARAGDL
jgi:hypothetical protein